MASSSNMAITQVNKLVDDLACITVKVVEAHCLKQKKQVKEIDGMKDGSGKDHDGSAEGMVGGAFLSMDQKKKLIPFVQEKISSSFSLDTSSEHFVAYFASQDSLEIMIETSIRFDLPQKGVCCIKVKEFEDCVHDCIAWVELGNNNPLQMYFHVFQRALEPYFHSFANLNPQFKRDEKNGVSALLHHLEMVRLALYQCQQIVNIPVLHVNKYIHPEVFRIINENIDVKSIQPEVIESMEKLLLECGKEVNKLSEECLSIESMESTAMEINYWNSLLTSFKIVMQDLGSEAMDETLKIMKKVHSIKVLTKFENDRDNFKIHVLRRADDYVSFLGNLPIKDFLSCKDMTSAYNVLKSIFVQLKKLKQSMYPLERVKKLISCLSIDTSTVILQILTSISLLSLEYNEFDELTTKCMDIFKLWDDEKKSMEAVALDISKKRDETTIKPRDDTGSKSRDETAIKLDNLDHKRVQSRLEGLRKFRTEHYDLKTVISSVFDSNLATDSYDTINQIARAYKFVQDQSHDILTMEDKTFELILQNYTDQIEKVETYITSVMRDKLGSAKNSSEMFRVFSQFNVLFFKPRISASVQEYQSELISKVQKDIQDLETKFKRSYSNSEVYHMSLLRDVPPVSGAIIWAKQIQRQLTYFLKRIDDIFGQGWERLKLLRQNENTWTMNDSLSNFMGIPMVRINEHLHRMSIQKPKVIGTAFAIGFLELVYEDSKNEWSTMKPESLAFLRDEEKNNKVSEGTSVKEATTILKDLGVGGTHIEEKNLRFECKQFKQKLDESIFKYFSLWQNEIHMKLSKKKWKVLCLNQQGKTVVGGPLFLIDYSSQNELTLSVNFHDDIPRFIKEFTFLDLEFLSVKDNFRNSIKRAAVSAISMYPVAVTLKESIRLYYFLRKQLGKKMLPLAARSVSSIHKLIADGFKHTWYKFKSISSYCKTLSEEIYKFQLETQSLVQRNEELMFLLEQMSNAPLDQDKLQECLSKIQEVVDEMNLSNFSNLSTWVDENVNNEIEKVLRVKLKFIIQEWVNTFESGQTSDMLINMRTFKIEISIRGGEMYSNPSVQQTRCYWLQNLTENLSLICQLRAIKSGRYDNVFQEQSEDQLNYSYLLSQMEDDILFDVYQRIENRILQAHEYMKTWMQYQVLWQFDTYVIEQKFGHNIHQWTKLLQDIQDAKNMIKSSENYKQFGLLTVFYKNIQSKIHLKYDATLRDILINFKKLLKSQAEKFVEKVIGKREALESIRLSLRMEDGYKFAIISSEIEDEKENNEDLVNQFVLADSMLKKYKIKLESDWIYSEKIQSEWNSLLEIYQSRLTEFETRKPELIQHLEIQESIIINKIRDVVSEWKATKPTSGSLSPKQALTMMEQIETRLVDIFESSKNLRSSQDALGLTPADAKEFSRIDSCHEELISLKEVWIKVREMDADIENIGETPMLTLNPKKVEQLFIQCRDAIKEYPAWMHRYDIILHQREKVNRWIASIPIVKSLKTEAMKERHWDLLKKKMKANWNYTDLTFMQLLSGDMQANEGALKEVLSIAQGELVLELYLKEIKDIWSDQQVELTAYSNKCSLIKNWDELFDLISDHTKSLGSMRASPYFKTFQAEVIEWETKLTTMYMICDIWLEVQRSWVYLEGIFIGNKDIKQQLPMEMQRFRTVNTEFINLMKRVSGNPIVLDVLQISKLQSTLEKLQQMLHKIQKRLGEYLESQRAAFPRMYFIGDDDCLSLLGRSDDPDEVQKHLKKMFAGINSLDIDMYDGGFFLKKMNSKEGESVTFLDPVTVEPNQRIHEWLGNLENAMKFSLASSLKSSFPEILSMFDSYATTGFVEWIDQYPAQIIVLSLQIAFTHKVESLFQANESLNQFLTYINEVVSYLSGNVLKETKEFLLQKKYEYLVTELVHQRDVLKLLTTKKIENANDFDWLCGLRFYYSSKEDDLQSIDIRIANASFSYGFEYLGMFDKLVQTPLTDRCYLALSQAIHCKMGGSPFGPAGTGKTETVKSLATQLGRYVLVFCCDENFDYHAMGRIFAGICMCGAWGCFDEFNRLEEKILSAVSQQILQIQTALRDEVFNIELVNRKIRVHEDTGIFITMNPGYAGRSNLPDNLKQLFRSVAMVKPDRELIAQVIMYTQGFIYADMIAAKIVMFFELCSESLSTQSHYDFGLRALKTVLVNAGHLKRKSSLSSDSQTMEKEQGILVQSILETMVPKLVGDDAHLLQNLVSHLFPGISLQESTLDQLKGIILEISESNGLVGGEIWMEKILQLYRIQKLSHGVILVGPTGCGKTTSWRTLLSAIEKLENVQNFLSVIDPKSLSKVDLYGQLDPTTREWTDGIFTRILRKIIDSLRGEQNQRHWIVFDGDVDPEWVENLNSVLDDNKIFTLPNGERLRIPGNVRILFEVRNLDYATLATVSRCGMIWFNQDVLSVDMVIENFLHPLKTAYSLQMVNLLRQLFCKSIHQVIEFCAEQECIMEFNVHQSLQATFTLIEKGLQLIHEQKEISDFNNDQLKSYVEKRFIWSLFWGFGSIMLRNDRIRLSQFLKQILMDSPEGDIVDFTVSVENSDWECWTDLVPHEEKTELVDTEIIPTPDTLRHEDLLVAWIKKGQSVILCGPPGSGKTMIMNGVLKALVNYDSISLNFSSATTPDIVMKTLEQYCTIVQTPNGYVMRPSREASHLVIFCDEINLPENDSYGTQLVITFMRQLIEQQGFWRSSDHSFVRVERLVFVGACNPPTDPGRVVMTPRFLRHCPVLFVDFPNRDSLEIIYGTLLSSLLPKDLSNFLSATTKTMVEFYMKSQSKFTATEQPHYIYSPRELSRWIRAIQSVLNENPLIESQDFIRLLIHEGMRIFADRLVCSEDQDWTRSVLDDIIREQFASHTDLEEILSENPILFSRILTQTYERAPREEFKKFLEKRMKDFSEEELEVKLIVFDSVLEHILRIDRVLKQPLGHMLLAGVSGVGKTVLSKFVAWMNNYTVFQIKAHSKYSLEDFEEDLRSVLRRAGTKGETICFIFDEANALESSFLEYMNSLLASGDVPGLFEEEEYTILINQCKSEIKNLGLMNIDSDDEVYAWFVKQVQRNLHLIFTINPANADHENRAATSPALFNRCVVDWFGDWSEDGLRQVALAFIDHLPFSEEETMNIVNVLVEMHNSVHDASMQLFEQTRKKNHMSPRHFLDLIQHFLNLYETKGKDVSDQQSHISRGLKVLTSTEDQVAQMQEMLQQKKIVLADKNKLADEKLKIIVQDKQMAQEKKQESMKLASLLQQQTEQALERKSLAEEDLAKVQPQLEEAKHALKQIKRRNLDEIRQLNSPPHLIRLTLEAVCIMLENKPSMKFDWTGIRKRMKGEQFIRQIIEFDSSQVTDKMRKKLSKDYFPQLPYESVKRASIACGPMIKWLESQVNYSIILQKVEPLQKEKETLERKAFKLKEQFEEKQESVAELEKKISDLEAEYAVLLRETQSIKNEIQTVNKRVERSKKLILSLADETVRWKEQSQDLNLQLETIVGDVLISSAFLTYSGYFDEYFRNLLKSKWLFTLLESGIFKTEKTDFDFIPYLSTAANQENYVENGLPQDNLYVQNAIIMENFNRYPIIIDPTGQAVEFLMNRYREKKIVKTSFLDPAFLKQLESSLRFGTPILVQDVEQLDPILNPVLNKEHRKIGGRILVSVGKTDIDVSENFNIFLSTRDPSYNFSADLASRVTFVNFTITPSSLQSQCLNMILRHERPEIQEQKSEQIKLQSQYRMKLRQLENDLLNSLSKSDGNILDNENLISTLENLKLSAADIKEKVVNVESVMQQLSKVSALYDPLANYCSKLFFALDQLQELSFLYQFSQAYFMDILNYVLNQKTSEDRVSYLISELFRVVFYRTSRGLLHHDQLPFALRLSQIKCSSGKDEVPVEEMDLFMKNGTGLTSSLKLPQNLQITKFQKNKFNDLYRLSAFSDHLEKSLHEDASVWSTILHGEHVEEFPICWKRADSKSVESFRVLLLSRMFQPWRVSLDAYKYVKSVFNDEFFSIPELDLRKLVKVDLNCFTPLLLVSSPGYDTSEKVFQLKEENELEQIAMGTSEAYDLAMVMFKKAIRKGSWILLKNVHLAPHFMRKLEKQIHELNLDQKIHQNFRLFLTSELNANLPAPMLRRAFVVFYETPSGLKANLKRTFSNLTEHQVNALPRERSLIYFMVGWLHAIVQERLRYIPLGWTKSYEFNESDLKWALHTIETWIVSGDGKTNIKPEEIAFKAIKAIFINTIYGGKIDNDFDEQILSNFVEDFLSPKVYTPEYLLTDSNICKLSPPSDSTYQGIMDWIESLPTDQKPQSLLLPANANRMIQSRRAKVITSKLAKIQNSMDIHVEYEEDRKENTWKVLLSTVKAYLKSIPESLEFVLENSSNDKSPLNRYFRREFTVATNLHHTIKRELNELLQVIQGDLKPTQWHIKLRDCIQKQKVPHEWMKYQSFSQLTMNEWISDFSARLNHLMKLHQAMRKEKSIQNEPIWMGGLLYPNAFITATRQEASKKLGLSLEELLLQMSVSATNGYKISNLAIVGARWENEKIQSIMDQSNEQGKQTLPTFNLDWISKDQFQQDDSSKNVPLYLNADRQHLLGSVKLSCDSNINTTSFYAMGTAILSWQME